MCDYLDYQDFFELESFDESCPCCGSTNIQEIDRWIGDDFDDFGLSPDQADRLLLRRYLCWDCDETFRTGEIDGEERLPG